MNPALAALAAVTIAGGVLAVASRDARATVLGLLVVMLGVPLVAEPWPDPLSILARIAATLLAIRLVVIGLRGEGTTGGTRIGWPADALVAGAAAVIGFGSHGLMAPALGPAEAQATGFALIALAIAPLLTGRDALRLSVGATLLLLGALSIRIGLDATPSQAEQLVGAILTIAIGGAIAVIATAARAAGGLAAIDAGRPGDRTPRPPDAHRPAPTRERATSQRPAPGSSDRTAGPRRTAASPGRAPASQGRSSASPERTPTGSTQPPAPRPRGPGARRNPRPGPDPRPPREPEPPEDAP